MRSAGPGLASLYDRTARSRARGRQPGEIPARYSEQETTSSPSCGTGRFLVRGVRFRALEAQRLRAACRFFSETAGGPSNTIKEVSIPTLGWGWAARGVLACGRLSLSLSDVCSMTSGPSEYSCEHRCRAAPGRCLSRGPSQIRTRGFPPSGSFTDATRGYVVVPLPSEVPVTWLPTSKRWSWFPSEARINTGRLRSAGSGRHPVPRRPRYFAALRLPRPFGRGSGSPRRRPTSMRTLFFTAQRTLRQRASVGEGSPDSPSLRILLRRAGTSQVPGPSSSCVPWSETPPGAVRPLTPSRAGFAPAGRQTKFHGGIASG